MLVLSRRPRERIILRNHATGEMIVVTTLRAEDGKARIGIEAEQRWEILREELVEREAA